MIVGKGSIASMLNDREDVIYFASGASNSSSVTEPELIRESLLLGYWMRNAIETDSMFVYFSTISIFFKDSQYTRHKKTIEGIIKMTCENFTILRLGNVWECTNPNTFINAYKANPYEPREEYKYMISKKQLNLITDNLPRTGKHEISIFGELLSVKECLNRIK